MALPTAIKTKKLKSIIKDIQSLGVKQGQSEVANYGTVLEKLMDDWGIVLTDSLKKSAYDHDNYTQGKDSGLINSINHTIESVGQTGVRMQIHIADYYDYVNEGVSGAVKKRNTPYSYGRRTGGSKKKDSPLRSAMREYLITKQGLMSSLISKNPAIYKGLSEKVIVERLSNLLARNIFLFGTKGSKFYDEIINQQNLDAFADDFAEATGKVLVFSLKQGLGKQKIA